MPDLIKNTEHDLVYYTSMQFKAFSRMRHAFFTRVGGVSTGDREGLNFRFREKNDEPDVLKNFELAAGVLGRNLDDIVVTKQTHSDHIAVVTEKPNEFGPALGEEAVDALLTQVPGVCLTGFFADCQLLLLYDSKTHAIGVVHAGWRGLQNQIIAQAVERMSREFGTRARDLTVAISPSICRNCFETDDDVYQALTGVYGERINDYIYKDEEKWHIDLKNVTYFVLSSLGVPPFNIDVSSSCTCCGSPKLFWSHRRCGEERGVHAGMICLT